MTRNLAGLFLLVITTLAFLMVSRVRYYSMKRIDFTKRMAVTSIVWIVFILYLVAIEPHTALLVVAVAYVLSGPILFLYRTALASRRDLKPERAPDSQS